MSLTDSTQENAVSLADANKTYKENVVAVDSAMTSIVSSDYSILQRQLPRPLFYNEAFVYLVAEAMDWANHVLFRLKSVPDNVRDNNAIISTLLADAQTQATALITDPNNSFALASLKLDLDKLSSTFETIPEYISPTISRIRDFQDKLPELSALMTWTATQALDDAIEYDPSYEGIFREAYLFFERMAGLVVHSTIPGVLQEWQTLQTQVNAAISDISKATSDKTSNNFNAVKADINDAITQWNAAYAQAGSLQLDLPTNTASL